MSLDNSVTVKVRRMRWDSQHGLKGTRFTPALRPHAVSSTLLSVSSCLHSWSWENKHQDPNSTDMSAA